MSTWVRNPAKRAIDVIASACLIAVTSPLLAVLGATVRVLMGRPVLFKDVRTGRGGRPIVVWKLRTMGPECDAQGRPVPEEHRITRLGGLLRASSLDELPQLVQVLSGDMSLVGPRPLPPRYLNRFTPEQDRRHAARPGLTGLAQVSGRNALDWDQKLALDVQYVDTATPLLDLTILLRTFLTIVRRDGIAMQGYVTSPEFLGTHAEHPQP